MKRKTKQKLSVEPTKKSLQNLIPWEPGHHVTEKEHREDSAYFAKRRAKKGKTAA